MRVLSRLSLNQRLGLAALLLGLIAIPARVATGPNVTLNTNELAIEVAREVDHVTPLDLADWIITQRADYRLVDLRTPQEFAQYHIPTAENVPLATLMEAPLGRQEKIVLYSEGGIHSAQAWMLLRAKGHTAVYMLRGGLDEWNDSVLFPTLAENPTPFQAERDEKLKAISVYFGGKPQVGGAPPPGGTTTTAVETPRVMPKVEAPALPSGAGTAAPKKKKEGC